MILETKMGPSTPRNPLLYAATGMAIVVAVGISIWVGLRFHSSCKSSNNSNSHSLKPPHSNIVNSGLSIWVTKCHEEWSGPIPSLGHPDITPTKIPPPLHQCWVLLSWWTPQPRPHPWSLWIWQILGTWQWEDSDSLETTIDMGHHWKQSNPSCIHPHFRS